jgi:hypothetical protein
MVILIALYEVVDEVTIEYRLNDSSYKWDHD